MRRKPLNTIYRSKLSKQAKQLSSLAVHLSNSGSRLERRFWKKKLFATLDPILQGRSDLPLSQALEYLYDSDYKAYDQLAFAIENTVESPSLSDEEDLLLLAVPIMAWSTFNIPSGKIEQNIVDALTEALNESVLSNHTYLVLTNVLFSPDQLPETYATAAELARQLGGAAKDRLQVHINAESLPETQHYLSDVRYLIGAVAVKKEQPVFKWQEDSYYTAANKEAILKKWQISGNEIIQSLMAGCQIQLLLPNGLYNATRAAEKETRVYSVRASIAFLTTILKIQRENIRVSVGAFVEQGEVEEYRMGFSINHLPDIVHGVVWPLIDEEYGNEPDPMYEKDILSQPDHPIIRSTIISLLKEVGIQQIDLLEERFTLEYCEDCGSPLYPNPEGELLHAEFPEDTELPDNHLH